MLSSAEQCCADWLQSKLPDAEDSMPAAELQAKDAQAQARQALALEPDQLDVESVLKACTYQCQSNCPDSDAMLISCNDWQLFQASANSAS